MEMDIIVSILKSYLIFCILVMATYTIRHFIFTLNRLFGKQKVYYGDIIDSKLPTLSVLIPMHNEEKVTKNILNLLIKTDYPKNILEIVPINDHSTDKTGEILRSFSEKYSFIKPIHRYTGRRGKPAALNEALKICSGEIVVVFDADYLPPKGILKEIAVNFKNPEVGAVMGRVIPINSGKNMLTRLLDLERTGGYQVDQQARYNLNLIPQYGGTVGGFRKHLILKLGGFDENVLAEDTELTFRLYTNGFKVVYANRAECWEEVPETWLVRAKQITRWSRGHNQVMFKYLTKVITSKHLNFWQKLDGILLLMVYLVPVILLLGWIDSLALFFLGEMDILSVSIVWLALGTYNSFGNFAPFFEIGIGAFLDGTTYRIRLLPLMLFNFMFNTWYISKGFFQALID